MTRAENVTSFLTKITQVRDELGVVGEVVTRNELVRTALNGMTKLWSIFVEGVVAREHLPNWDHLWDDLVQEEIRLEYCLAKQKEVEYLTLVRRGWGIRKDIVRVRKKDQAIVIKV